MRQDEIIEMARQAGYDEHQAKFDTRIEAIAKLVAEREREACLEIIDNFVDFPYLEPTMKAIRARGQE